MNDGFYEIRTPKIAHFRVEPQAIDMIEARINEAEKSLKLEALEGNWTVNGEAVHIDISAHNPKVSGVLLNGRSHEVFVEKFDPEEKVAELRINGKKAVVALTTELDLLLKRMGLNAGASGKAKDIKAPMPGLIHSISVEGGTAVKKGDAVIILEAMKMENVIKSPADGVVEKVHVEQGASVDKNQLLISFG